MTNNEIGLLLKEAKVGEKFYYMLIKWSKIYKIYPNYLASANFLELENIIFDKICARLK